MNQTSRSSKKVPMPKQASTLFAISIIEYLEKKYAPISIQSFIDEINNSTPYYVENLETGRLELISLEHLRDENYWVSHNFMNTFTETVRKNISEQNLFFNAGDALYNTRNFLKTAVGLTFYGPEKMVALMQQENDKYNRTKDIVLLNSEKGHVVFRAVFFEGIVTNPFGMEWGAGLLRSYIRLSGATNVEVSHKWVDQGPQEPGGKGRAICEFEVRYKDPGFINRFFKTFVFHIPMVKKEMDYANQIQAEHNERILTQHKIIEQKTNDLKQANAKLVELDRLKTEFYTNITHELRTPLTLIQSQIDAVRREHFGQTVEASSDVFKSVEQNVGLLTKLIDNLLDFSKIESGKINTSFAKILLSECLQHISANFEAAMKYKGLDFEYIDGTQELYALIDKNLFEKGLYNLFSNAMKFTPAGGRVDLFLGESKNNVLISIRDTGIGIAKDNHKKIFDRFHQVDSSSTRKYEGVGIGLALTKKIVELHKGRIEVESKLGKGTTFTIRLPKVENALQFFGTKERISANQNKERPDMIRGTLKSKKLKYQEDRAFPADIKPYIILIVEDNEDMLSFLERLIFSKYRVITAINGKKAWAVLNRKEVDLVISDIMMPEMDGLELLKKIRTDRRLSWLPVIMLTARADFPMKMQGFSHGANDYIVKPFKTDELLARVKSQLSLVKLRRKYKTALNGRKEKPLTNSTIIAIDEVQKYIELNYQKHISRKNLAAIVEMSPDHLSRMFKKHIGKTIRGFINELRIKDAQIKLETDGGNIVDIAFEVGFENLSSFKGC